ncbi:hypothetical protein BDV93DRAFT_525057 [Ceratobasidium sp. AG-I]|nr:hypothetical protein BDV93DRAFT_525057 [Ceratobasidium sp. AG-I]
MQPKSTTGSMQAGLEHHNSEQLISGLPSEILSCIFTLGRRTSGKLRGGRRLSFGELVVRVCRRWRAIALDIPMLWTHITLSDQIPYRRSAMRLARSGDCVPLDIAIVMDGNFMDGISIFEDPKCAVRARSALEFIVAQGGATSRWETLTICSTRTLFAG